MAALLNPTGFFNAVRHGVMGPKLEQSEVEGCQAILSACEGSPLADAAYELATAWHETAHTLQPVKEIGGPAYFFRLYDLKGQRPHVAEALGNTEPGDGARYAGRGYVQLTGRANYLRAGRALGLGSQLVDAPDRAQEPEIAAKVMAHGMAEGWFTGRKLADFLPADRPATRAEFMAARRIINGTDRNDLIADYAVEFQIALQAGQWWVKP
jgi:putative chitinase